MKTMDWKEYEKATQSTAVYPEHNKLPYLLMGLGNEAGEVQGVYKKYLRGDFDYATLLQKLEKELGDVAWYLAQLTHHYAPEALEKNITKLQGRKERGTLKGNGDDR